MTDHRLAAVSALKGWERVYTYPGGRTRLWLSDPEEPGHDGVFVHRAALAYPDGRYEVGMPQTYVDERGRRLRTVIPRNDVSAASFSASHAGMVSDIGGGDLLADAMMVCDALLAVYLERVGVIDPLPCGDRWADGDRAFAVRARG